MFYHMILGGQRSTRQPEKTSCSWWWWMALRLICMPSTWL